MRSISMTPATPRDAAAGAMEMLNEIVRQSRNGEKRRAAKICKTPLPPKKLFSAD